MDTRFSGIADRIRETREKADISQTELAKRVNSTQQIISAIERKGREITAPELLEIAEALDADPLYLLTGAHSGNYLLARDLGLTDDSIRELQGEDRDVPMEGFPMLPKEKAAAVVNAILSREDFIDTLYWYLFGDCEKLSVIVGWLDEGREPEQLYLSPRDVLYPQTRSFEPLFRLRMLDELKKLRNALHQGEGGKEHGKH